MLTQEATPQRMTAWNDAQAAIVTVSVFERDPQAEHADRVRMQITRILVQQDLAADVGLLEDQHGLRLARFDQAETIGQCSDSGVLTKSTKYRIQFVKCMPYFIDR